MKNLKLLILIIFFIPLKVLALDLPDTYSDKVLIYDLTTDEVLLAKNASLKTNIASLTKIMTTITGILNMDSLDKKITITSDMLAGIYWDASVAGLKVGDVVTNKDLLYASILPSGADATQVIAYETSGGIANFVAKMNSLALELGMTNTHFVNTTGLDIEGHYSTAEDILKLLKFALQNETFKTVFTTREYTLTNGLKVKSTLNTYNRVLNLDLSRIKGSKTGFTKNAGLCMATLTESNNHDIIIITLNAPKAVNGKYYNLLDALTLSEFIDNNFQNLKLFTQGQEITRLKVNNSKEKEYIIYSKTDVYNYVPVDYDVNNLKVEYIGLNDLSYKNKIGEELGIIKYYYNDAEIYEEKVILDTNFNLSILAIIKNNPLYLGTIILIMIVILVLLIYKKKQTKISYS